MLTEFSLQMTHIEHHTLPLTFQFFFITIDGEWVGVSDRTTASSVSAVRLSFNVISVGVKVWDTLGSSAQMSVDVLVLELEDAELECFEEGWLGEMAWSVGVVGRVGVCARKIVTERSGSLDEIRSESEEALLDEERMEEVTILRDFVLQAVRSMSDAYGSVYSSLSLVQMQVFFLEL